MITKTVCCAGACASGMLLVIACLGGEGPWPAAEQPGLREALEQAPLLETESLGEPARGVNVWERWFVPNHDGKTWDLLQIYFKEYYGPTWLVAVDLGTGAVNKQRLPDGHQFYLSGRALGFDGKYYIATPSRRTWSMGLFVYDPATNTIEDRGEIVPGLGGEVRPLAVGPDGRIYGTGTRGNQVGLYIYDPELGKVVEDYDVTQEKIVREIVPVAQARATGLIAETAPGRLRGLTVDTADPRRPGNGLLYGVDVATG